jgi:hypothetical protein
MSSPIARRLYVQRVLDLYRLAPGTTRHLRRTDRRLAGELHDRGVSLEIVCAAMILAVARRTFRSKSAPTLPPDRDSALHPAADRRTHRPATRARLSQLYPMQARHRRARLRRSRRPSITVIARPSIIVTALN